MNRCAKIIKILLILTLVITLTPAKAYSSYKISYDPSSPIKQVPLNNSIITIKVFLGGTPQGELMQRTDGSGQFSLDRNFQVPVTVRVVSINNQLKYKAKCCGISKPQSQIIQIICLNTKQIANLQCNH